MSSALKKLVMMANQASEVDESKYPPYLCFQALESNFQVALTGDWHNNVCQYSFNCEDWYDLPARTYTPPIGVLQKVYFKANLTPTAVSPTEPNGAHSIGKFVTTKKCRLSGSPTSMLHGDDCDTDKSVPNYGLAYLFMPTKAVSVSEDFFNFTSVKTRACFSIFSDNGYLKGYIYITKAADTSTANGVFMKGFTGCKLDSVVITTKEYAWQTYSAAFVSSNIKTLDLPATAISPSMYFKICQYNKMLERVFINGRGLILGTDTYISHIEGAFQGCTKLSKVTYLVAGNPFAKKYTNNWLMDVAEEGTIIFNKFAFYDPENYRNGNIDNIEGSETLGEAITWGIPANWTVKYCDPDNPDDLMDNRDETLENIDGNKYIKVSYIQTNGDQYLDSGIVLDSNCRVEVDALLGDGSLKWMLFGNTGDTNNIMPIELNGANTGNAANRTTRFGDTTNTNNIYSYGSGKRTYAVDKTGIYIDDKKVDWQGTPSDFSHETSFYILAERYGDTVANKARTGTQIYGVRVYKNGDLIADMIPRISIFHGQPGLYDRINKRFLTNIGTGEFTYG